MAMRVPKHLSANLYANLYATLAVAGLAVLAPGSAQAQFWQGWPVWQASPVWHGNDTGGIIPWSCENEAAAPQAAAVFCAKWHKYPRITGVTRRYGDYISFNCLWSPNVARYGLPAVPTRSYCAGEGRPLLTK
jgi:hypothetical protein